MTDVRVPSEVTLRKYGLSKEAWRALLREQGGACGVCGRVPKTGNLCIDHEHLPGWKRMSDEDRASAVRGICCYWCNARHLARGMTVERAQQVIAYLQRYAARRAQIEARRKAA